MAYYSSSYYDDNHGEYNCEHSLTPYHNSYYSVPVPDSVPYSSYEFNEHENFAYDQTPFFAAYDHPSSCSRIAFSASTFIEPKHIEYDPSFLYPAQTRFIVSYSVSEFNEPEFEEYDPTPYGGGYDPAATYGKPLPHSNEICYPRSVPDPNASSLDGFSYGSVTAPYGKEEDDRDAARPKSESQPTGPKDAEQQPQEYGNGHSGDHRAEERKENHRDGSYPADGDETGNGNGSSSEHGYGNGKLVPQIPSGYGLEAMDLCEGLFGYWPCLARNGTRGDDCQEISDRRINGNPWKETADYLFGSSNPYGERREDRDGYGNVIYGYRRHYQQEPLYQHQRIENVEYSWFDGMVENDEDSWFA